MILELTYRQYEHITHDRRGEILNLSGEIACEGVVLLQSARCKHGQQTNSNHTSQRGPEACAGRWLIDSDLEAEALLKVGQLSAARSRRPTVFGAQSKSQYSAS